MAEIKTFTDAQKKKLKLKTFRSRDTWLPFRRPKIGGSDAQTLFGCGFKGRTPATLWESKVYRGGVDDDTDADSLRRKRRGVILERAVGDLFIEESALDLYRFKAGEFVVAQHPDLEWAATTLDSMVFNDEFGGWCPAELKQVSHFAGADWTAQEAPIKVQIQVQMQLLCTGAEWGVAVGWVGGDDVRLRWIQRHAEFQDALVQVCTEFYTKYLLPAIKLFDDGYVNEVREYIPPLTGSRSDTRMLGRLFAENAGEIVRMGYNALRLVGARDEIKAHVKACNSRLAWINNLLMEAMGTAGIAVLPNGRLLQQKTVKKEPYEVPATSYRQLGDVSMKNTESLMVPAEAPMCLLQTERKPRLFEVTDKERKKLFQTKPVCMCCGGRIAKEGEARVHSIEHEGKKDKKITGLICSRCVIEMTQKDEEDNVEAEG